MEAARDLAQLELRFVDQIPWRYELIRGPRQALEQKRTLSSGQDVTITETPRLELGPNRPRRRGPVDF